MSKLKDVIIKMACAGKFLTLSRLSAPTYCEIIEAKALRVCPKTQMSIDIKVVTIPTAANASVGLSFTFPTMAASVKDRIGSETPEISAGMASLLICLRLILLLTGLTHSSKKGTHFAWENRSCPSDDTLSVRKIFDFDGFWKRYPSVWSFCFPFSIFLRQNPLIF